MFKILLSGIIYLVSTQIIAQTGVIIIEEYFKENKDYPNAWGSDATLYLGDQIIEHPVDLTNNRSLPNYASLEPGKYVLKYHSIFDQAFKKQIIHDGHTEQIVKICIDEFRDDTSLVTFAGQLMPGDTLVIMFYGYGCEPYDGGKLTLVKRAVDGNVCFEQDWNSRLIKKKRRLKPAHVEAISLFERKIKSLNSMGGGSMTFCYKILLNGNKVYFKENVSGQWEGMGNLCRLIFRT